MREKVYMVCGVPGSGKSWVCEQLTGKFTYLKHDDYIGEKLHARTRPVSFLSAIGKAAEGDKPVLIDCPFAERELRGKIEALGLTVEPYFIVEPPEIVQGRYRTQRGRELPQASVTRAVSIRKRAVEWAAPYGTSREVLAMLKQV